ANLTIGSVSTNGGNISVIASAPTISVASNSQLIALQGNITLENTNTATGTIVIGQGANLAAESSNASFGFVNIVIGSIPVTPVAGTVRESNFSPNKPNSGTIFFGTNGITASNSTNAVLSDAGKIVFNTGSRPASAITLNGGTQITSISGRS